MNDIKTVTLNSRQIQILRLALGADSQRKANLDPSFQDDQIQKEIDENDTAWELLSSL